MNIDYKLILASKSPRRKQLMQEAGFDFEVRLQDIEETYPDEMPKSEIALYLAEKKANAFKGTLEDNEIIITSDTTVVQDNRLFEKPANREEAIQMIRSFSSKSHEVITAVCLLSNTKVVSFDDTTVVHFLPLTEEEIEHYVDHYKPYDKAGAYGIQEWIGMIGIEKIEGSYFNVVGLPITKVYQALKQF